MLKSGFTTKFIEKFKEVLPVIIQNKNDEKYEESIKVIDSTLRELFRLNLKSFNSLSDDNLIQMITINGIVDADRAIIIGKLLQEEAEIFGIQEKTNESLYIYFKSLNLYLEAYDADDAAELAWYYGGIDTISEKVSEYVIPFKIKELLFGYYSETSKYDKAEDVLYDMLDEKNKDEKIIKKGILFYKRLLEKNDDELLKGNLPRNEVEESLSSLCNL